MRVSIDARYIRERPSGIGAYVQALVDRVPLLAPADTFHFWANPKAKRPLSTAPNTSETTVGAGANSLPTLLYPSRLVDLGDVDVLHAPFNILGRGVRCNTVVTIHDLMWLLTPTLCEGLNLATPALALFYRDGILRALREATRLIAISNATADSIVSVIPSAKSRLRVIPHGVEARFSPPKDPELARRRAATLLGSDAPFFFVVGQNAPYKNHEGILEGYAASGLAPRVRLVFLQRLYAGAKLPKRARALGVTEGVSFLSGLSDDDVLTLLQSALALIQFSRNEGFGMPALEAMACGTPVVASTIPPLVEILGDAGLFSHFDGRTLGQSLKRIASEPRLRDELSSQGLERAYGFSWDRAAQSHLDVYREASEPGPGDHP